MFVNRIGREGYGSLLAALGLSLLVGTHVGITGSTTDLVALLAIGVFAAIVLLTISAPHVLVAGAIPIFASIPTLKVLVLPWVGPLKDAIIVAAVIGTVIVALQRHLAHERQPMDGVLLILVGAFLALYVVNLGGGFNAQAYRSQWLQGVRLAAEPLLLLLVGLNVRRPGKVLRWSLVSFLVTACAVALYGLAQQVIGEWGLAGMGYEFDINIRTISGRLRSFGTLDEPFAYASFLLAGVAMVMFMRLKRWVTASIASLLLLGLTVSYVRTAAVILVALFSMWLAQRGQAVIAVFALGAVIAASVVLLAGQGASETRTVQVAPSTYLSINGRTTVWKTVLGTKSQWPLGQGVGAVGTAADRAKFGVYQQNAGTGGSKAVDSGYLAAVADVGFLGLAVLLGVFGRLGQLYVRYARRGSEAAVIGGALLVVMMLDAVTRASFIGFPTAFLGMLLVGVSINAASSSAAASTVPHP